MEEEDDGAAGALSLPRRCPHVRIAAGVTTPRTLKAASARPPRERGGGDRSTTTTTCRRAMCSKTSSAPRSVWPRKRCTIALHMPRGPRRRLRHSGRGGLPRGGDSSACFNLDAAEVARWVEAGCYIAFGGRLPSSAPTKCARPRLSCRPACPDSPIPPEPVRGTDSARPTPSTPPMCSGGAWRRHPRGPRRPTRPTLRERPAPPQPPTHPVAEGKRLEKIKVSAITAASSAAPRNNAPSQREIGVAMTMMKPDERFASTSPATWA